MEVSIKDLLDQVEFEPVSLSDPFKSIAFEASTMEVLRFIPIIGFIALIIAAIWRQSKKYPVKAFGDIEQANK